MSKGITCNAFFDILNSKYYSQNEISELKESLQRKSGTPITLLRPNQSELILQCSNAKLYQCAFYEHFKKVQENCESQRYQLIKSSDKHSYQCINTHLKIQLIASPWIINSSSSKKSQIESNITINPEVRDLKQQENSQYSDLKQQGFYKQNQKDIKMLYSLEQIGLLKKQLELRSKGLLSKSTESIPKLKIIQEQLFCPIQINQIYFHCKYDPQQCPYRARLKLSQKCRLNKSQKQVFELEILNQTHNSQCLLDQEDICFNYMSMKIDKEFDTLLNILKQKGNEIKPKEILKKFAHEIGQQDQNFIYKGIYSKLKRRSIKKYFDNSLAKAKSILHLK